MARLHGRHGEVAIAATTSPAGSPSDMDFSAVGSLRAWSISFDRPPIEKTSLRSDSLSYLVGMEDVRGSFEGVFSTDTIQALLTAGDDPDSVWIRITPSTEYPELFFQGSAWLGVTASGAVADAVTVSGTFIGNGVWQKSYSA